MKLNWSMLRTTTNHLQTMMQLVYYWNKNIFLGFDTGKNEHIFPITHGISDIC